MPVRLTLDILKFCWTSTSGQTPFSSEYANAVPTRHRTTKVKYIVMVRVTAKCDVTLILLMNSGHERSTNWTDEYLDVSVLFICCNWAYIRAMLSYEWRIPIQRGIQENTRRKMNSGNHHILKIFYISLRGHQYLTF